MSTIITNFAVPETELVAEMEGQGTIILEGVIEAVDPLLVSALNTAASSLDLAGSRTGQLTAQINAAHSLLIELNTDLAIAQDQLEDTRAGIIEAAADVYTGIASKASLISDNVFQGSSIFESAVIVDEATNNPALLLLRSEVPAASLVGAAAFTALKHNNELGSVTNTLSLYDDKAQIATPIESLTIVDENATASTLTTKSYVQQHVAAAITTLNDDITVQLNQIATGNNTYSGDMVVEGNLFVEGELNAVSSNNLVIGDRVITLNSDAEGDPVLGGGVEINRGNAVNAKLHWDESIDRWVAGQGNNLQYLIRENDIADVVREWQGDQRYVKADGTSIMQRALRVESSTDTAMSVKSLSAVLEPAYVLSTQSRLSAASLSYSETDNSATLELSAAGSQGTATAFKLSEDKIVATAPVKTTAYTIASDTPGTLTTKGYVDDNFVGTASNQTIAGDKTFTGIVSLKENSSIQKDEPYFSIKAINDTSPHLLMLRGDVPTFRLHGYTTRSELQRVNINSEVTNSLRMYDGYTDSNVRIYAPDHTDPGSLTTRGYVDGAFIKLTGDQSIAGEKTFTDHLKIVNGYHMNLYASDATHMRIRPETNFLRMERIVTDDTNTYIDLYDDYIITNKRIAGVDGFSDDHFMTKGYMDSTFVKLSDYQAGTGSTGSSSDSTAVKLTGDQTIEGVKTFTETLTVNAIAPRSLGYLYSASPWQYSSAMQQSDFSANQLPNAQWSLDKFVGKSGNQVIAGDLKLDIDGAQIHMNSKGTASPQLFMSTPGRLAVQMYYYEPGDRFIIAKRDTTSDGGGIQEALTIHPGYINATTEFRAGRQTESNHDDLTLTTKKFVEDNFLSKVQSAPQALNSELTLPKANILSAQGVDAELDMSVSGNANPRINMWRDGALAHVIFGTVNRMLLRVDTGDTTKDFSFYEHVVDFSTPITVDDYAEVKSVAENPRVLLKRGNANSSALLGYASYLSLQRYTSAGVAAGELRIADTASTFNTKLSIDTQLDIDGGVPSVFMNLNGQESFGLRAGGSYGVMRRYDSNGAAANELRMFDAYSLFDNPVRAPATLDSDASTVLTTKSYVDEKVAAAGGDSGGSGSGGGSRYTHQLWGKFEVDTNNQWTTPFITSGGPYYYKWDDDGAGAGALPDEVDYHQKRGLAVRAGSTLERVVMNMRVLNTSIENWDLIIYYRHHPDFNTVESVSPLNVTEIYRKFPQSTNQTNGSTRRFVEEVNFEFPSDGDIMLYVRFQNTGANLSYCLASIAFDFIG